MAEVTGLTAVRMLAIEAASVVSGIIDAFGHLILTTHGGSTIDAGYVIASVPDATTSVKGIVELATEAETSARTSDSRAVTPASLAATYNGLDSRLDAAEALGANHESRLDVLEVPVDPRSLGMTGELKIWPVPTIPTGWLQCNGAEISRTTYAALFAVLGTTYGVGDGSTTFNLPDLRGRLPVGFDNTQSEFNATGKTGGAKTHTLTSAEMPSHTHTQTAHSHSFQGNGALTDGSTGTAYVVQNGTFYGFRAQQMGSTAAVNQATGGGGAHNNLQPYITMRYIIKT